MATAAFSSESRNQYSVESARIQQEFVASGNGRAAVHKRAALVDQIVLSVWEKLLSQPAGGKGFALAAIGGYGRKCLFPYSDVDLLLLHAERGTEDQLKDPIRSFSQELWDMGFKLSPTSRVLSECDRFDPTNVEFTIALLDCRYLAGDPDLFARLHDKLIPNLVMRESQNLVQRLAEVTRNRHGKFGSTVFHLEPNVKEAPGGLRDYNVAHWLALISAMDKLRDWPGDKDLLPLSLRKQVDEALDFLKELERSNG